jgi:cell division initiation protein
MGITPTVVRQKEFSTKFRGFDIQEIDSFLEEVAKEIEYLNNKVERALIDKERLDLENQGYREREDTMKKSILQSQKVLDQMKENAEKSSQNIVAEAEIRAEKILSRAHNRLSQLHNDINELKRQRIQLEMQIGSILESHSKMLEITKDENKAADETDSTLKFLNHG